MTRYRQSFYLSEVEGQKWRHSKYAFFIVIHNKHLLDFPTVNICIRCRIYLVYKQMYKYMIIICWRWSIVMQLFLTAFYKGKSNLNSWRHWGYITLSQLLLQLKMSHPFSSTWDLSRRQLSYIKHISLHVTGINHVLRMLNNQIMSWPPDYCSVHFLFRNWRQ